MINTSHVRTLTGKVSSVNVETMTRRTYQPLSTKCGILQIHQLHLQNSSQGQINDAEDGGHSSSPLSIGKIITLYTPIWALLAATIGIKRPDLISPIFGSLTIMQGSLSFLMLAMGLTITPQDLWDTMKNPFLLFVNATYCFGIMPLLSWGMSTFLQYTTNEATGIILLGSVSGGQASNLFTLLAGGDVALSVVCTFTTTILGAIATPFLVQSLLGCSVAVNGMDVLRSVVRLTLLPLLVGLSCGLIVPKSVKQLCPPLGVIATLFLVAGGASNSVSSLTINHFTTITASCLLPILGGMLALLSSKLLNITEKAKRAIVIETLSKSPTLAYVLAIKHFGHATAAIPAAAMVSLAVIGALVSSFWSSIWPITDE
jgi:BASS family bile acid:Na+ symporter